MRGCFLWDAKNNPRDYVIARNFGSGLRDRKTLLGTLFLKQNGRSHKRTLTQKGKLSNTYNSEDLALNGTTELTTLVLHLKRIFELPQLIPKIN